MKKLLFLIVLLLSVSIVVKSQCPSYVQCDSSEFKFVFTGGVPNSSLIDEVSVNVNGSWDTLVVDSIVADTIFIAKGNLDCSDTTTQTKYYYNNAIVGTCNNNFALPVELMYFRGKIDNGIIKLDWQTASEEQNSHFEIQLSKYDTSNFEMIDIVQGYGTTNNIVNYSLILPINIGYYRLKQVDYDDKYVFSPTIYINDSKTDENVFPLFEKRYNLIGQEDTEGNLKVVFYKNKVEKILILE